VTDPGNAGFTLIETLIATALMLTILAALATVTAQWLPNWNRGLARVQHGELLALGLERVVADLGAAEYIPPHRATRHPFFDGAELSVTFLRSTIGPNSPAGIEVVRIAETADARGVALVRLHAPFRPLEPDQAFDPRRLADPVVLSRAPYRVSFAYAGPDRAWRPTWSDARQLPSFVRVTVRNAATGQILSASTAAPIHVNAPAECVRSRNPRDCGNQEEKLPQGQKQL
jgi:general secretion pathway protein J